MSSPLLAGAARRVITPPVGVDLCGFGARPGPSIGVRDDLYASALYLSRDDQQVLILSADLIGLHRDEVALVRSQIQEATGIAPEAIMVCTTHTHSGPATHAIQHLGKQDGTYLAWLYTELATVGCEAREAASPASIARARVPVQVGINRRISGGVVAPYADVLSVWDSAEVPRACLFCHAAHAVTMGGANQLISGDWAGAAQRHVQQGFGPQCVPVYLQGCCGNINSAERGEEFVEMQGRKLATAVLASQAAAPHETEPRLGACSVQTALPLMAPPPVEEAERLLVEAQELAAKARVDKNYGAIMMYDGWVQWSQRLVGYARKQDWPREVPFEVQALALGSLAVVGLPGEVFVEYGLNLQDASPFAATAVTAYTNGMVGYVPTAAAYDEGGYEVDNAIRYYGTTMLDRSSEQVILAAAREALTGLS